MGQTKKKRETDITWIHCESVPPHRLLVKCKYCSHSCWGGIARMKHHLAGTKEHVIACPTVPEEVRQLFLKLLDDKEKARESIQECFKEVDAQDASAGKGTIESFAKKGKTTSMKQKTMNEMLKDREVLIQDICKCIYGNALPFNLVRSPLFSQMLKSVGEYGRGLKPPSYHEHSKGRELARPAVTRFATVYLTLHCIMQQKNALRSMFASEEWATSNYASKSEAKEVVNTVLCDTRFWKSIQYCLKCVSPLVKVLRLVDGDSKPAMPYIYEAMDRAKEQIAANFKNQESRYKKVWKIIDTRWNLQLHRPLHAAAYYLNPKFHYDKIFNPDSEVLFGLYETIERMVPDRRIRFGIDQQLDRFKTTKGLFGMSMAIDTREKKQPESPCLPIDASWMDIHESFTLEEGTPSKKRKRGPRNLNAKKNDKGKSIIEDESEVEEIIAIGEEGEEENLTEEDEDELSDVDLGDDE
ncbi:Ribonuclease H-like superfamily [Sesbania bispinosa]|nr:Ribonuclease H-like superfamily [Sesbania bispinosa]